MMGKKEEMLELLIEYISGRLSSEKHFLIEEKIAKDPVLQELVEVLSDLRTDDEVTDWQSMRDPSHKLFERLLKDVKLQRRDSSGNRGITIFDSKHLPLPEGIRSEAVDTRRIKFIIGAAHLEISIYPVSPNSFEVIGQLSGYEADKSLEITVQSGKVIMKAGANKYHLFRFPRVPAGKYDLTIMEEHNTIGKIDLEL